MTAAYAQEPLGKKEKKSVVAALAANCGEWKTVSLSGKLRMDILPLSPSVKIFMERDSLVRISLRAPLVGEVGRAEIDNDSILVVNKMKKTYVKESLAKVFASYPGGLSDIQDILLGRVVIPGYGLISEESWKVMDIFDEAGTGYTMLPGPKAEIEGFTYGYLLDKSPRATALAVVPAGKENVIVGVTYSYPDDGIEVNVSYQTPKKVIEGTLDLDRPDWNSKGFEAIKINSRFRRMDFNQFLKSF